MKCQGFATVRSEVMSKEKHLCSCSTFSMRGSVAGEYVGVLKFSDVIQADAQANVIHDLFKEETR